ncbi:MAG: phosphomannomutase [Nitrospirae bacterium]|nr:phosphomannomutase [Nitrospirota bacterium]
MSKIIATFNSAASCWKEILSDSAKNRNLLAQIERFARENTEPSKIVFGTSGWRGEIGTDFTFNNLRIVTAAIIEMFKMQEDSIMNAIGVSDFKEIQKRGVIVGHDNRFLGSEFAMEVLGMLQKEGIKTWYAGEATTPEFSTGIEMLQAACSINLTPSHNPSNYAGFKFNPSDGGPAGPEITKAIENIANGLVEKKIVLPSVKPEKIDKVDLTKLYIEYIQRRKTIDLNKIRDFLKNDSYLICIDNVYGATRGRMQKILGESNRIIYLRTEDDVLFGGIAPEPSEKNMEGIERILSKTDAQFTLGAIMDPDGDRIRLADGKMQIPINYFGTIALHFLYTYKKIDGIVVKSVATSNFVNAVAKGLGIPVRETKVGFKNFRPYLISTSLEKAIIAFEESDGISGYNHTLEKDAIFGLLLAIEIIASTGKNLSDYLKELMDEYGYFYPERSGIAVDRSLSGEKLLAKLSIIKDKYRKGTIVNIGGEKRTVQDVVTIDGTKLIFDDGSWLMIRPSGTEPKVRFYIESRTQAGKNAVSEIVEQMTKEALGC